MFENLIIISKYNLEALKACKGREDLKACNGNIS